MKRVLVVDDDRENIELLTQYLAHEGLSVQSAADGEGALHRLRAWKPHLILLDVNMPGVSGIDLIPRIRSVTEHDYVSVVLVSGAMTLEDVNKGMNAGADDYLTKPFSPRELVARIHAMLRRPRLSNASGQSPQEGPPRVFGALSIDVAGREVHLGSEVVTLTRTEFDLLEALSARPKLVFSRRNLIDTVWDQTWVGDEHLVDVHLGHLRRKLGDDPGAPRFVLTVRGVGYRMGEGT